MARNQTNGTEKKEGKMVKVVTGIVLSLVVVAGAVLLIQPKDAGAPPASAAPAVEETPYVSSNRETIVTGPDGQQVIQNSFDGSMVNFDGSPYSPMMTPEQLGSAAAPVAKYDGVIPTLSNDNIVMSWFWFDGQWLALKSDGSFVNMGGSADVPMPVDEGSGGTTVAKAKSSQAPVPSPENFMFWYEGRWVVQNADGSITDENGNKLW